MTAPRNRAVDGWRFDGKTLAVRVPMRFARRGGRKMIITPDGRAVWAPATPRSDDTLIRALARAHRWKRLLDEGRYRSAGELAQAEGVTRSFVNRPLRLALLAVDIIEVVVEARPPKPKSTDPRRQRSATDASEVDRLPSRLALGLLLLSRGAMDQARRDR